MGGVPVSLKVQYEKEDTTQNVMITEYSRINDAF